MRASRFWSLIFCLLMPAVGVAAQDCERLDVQSVGSSQEWGSGWLDLEDSRDFAPGETLRLQIRGKASTVLVRLLRQGGDPNSLEGVIGEPVQLDDRGPVSIELQESFDDVVQISVHGGPNPWGIQLGADNGPATIISAEVCM